MAAGDPPTIFPPLPINIPGNQGRVLFNNGTAQSWFQPAQQIVPLATKEGGALSSPAVVPPVTFILITDG